MKFASDEMPSPLKAAFGEVDSAKEPFNAQPELRTEVTRATLHDLAVLRREGRIPREGQEGRIDLLVIQIVNGHGG